MKHLRLIVLSISALVNVLSFFLPAIDAYGLKGGVHVEYGYQFYSFWVFAIILVIGSVATWRWDKNSEFVGNVLSVTSVLLLIGVFFFTTGIFSNTIRIGYWLWISSSAVIALLWLPIKKY